MRTRQDIEMATFAYSVGGEQDRQTIEAYAGSCGLIVAATFQDRKSWRTPWRQREQGSQLAELLQAGDHVIMGGGGTFAGAADFLQTIKDLAPLEITVHLAQVKWRTGSTSLAIGRVEAPFVEKIAAAHADAVSQWQSENTAWGLVRAAQAGKRYCRHPGYGRRWRRNKRVIDEEECQVAGWIRVWRDQGFSWYQMARVLLRRKLKTKDGGEWSAARVRRVYLEFLKWRPAKG